MNSIIFHLTHYKAGSQWISEILYQSILGVQDFYRLDPIDLLRQEIQPNSVYSPTYLTKQEFQVWTGERTIDDVKNEITSFEWEKIRKRIPEHISKQNKVFLSQLKTNQILKFFVIRDLRDSIISAYFSVKYSHIEMDRISKRRKILEDLSKEDGITYMMKKLISVYACIQRSWLDSPDISIFRYEDFIDQEFETFWKLIQFCKIEIDSKNLREIVNKNSFSKKTGRKPGEEDIYSHLRSGTSGNWKNHFTSKHKRMFKKLFGNILIETGYEKDNNW